MLIKSLNRWTDGHPNKTIISYTHRHIHAHWLTHTKTHNFPCSLIGWAGWVIKSEPREHAILIEEPRRDLGGRRGGDQRESDTRRDCGKSTITWRRKVRPERRIAWETHTDHQPATINRLLDLGLTTICWFSVLRKSSHLQSECRGMWKAEKLCCLGRWPILGHTDSARLNTASFAILNTSKTEFIFQ